MRKIAFILAFLFAALLAHASDEQDAYCAYVIEQGKAQADLLRAPNAVFGPTQPSMNQPATLAWGFTSSIANQRKAGMTLDAARKNCDLYKSTTEAQRRIFFALPSIEKGVLKNRLRLIQDTSDKLDVMIAENMKLVEVQNLSRQSVYSLQAAKLRLDSSRATTLTGITTPYVPPLSSTPLRELIQEKMGSEVAAQKSLARLAKQNDWDVSLAVGAYSQVNPGLPPATYGSIGLSYNLGSRRADKHIDASVQAYTQWKETQGIDVTVQANILQKEITETVQIDEEQLKVLLAHDADIDQTLQSLNGVDTAAALTFKNQLQADRLVLQVDIQDMQFRLTLLRQYLIDNF
jgi:hypothetical protein